MCVFAHRRSGGCSAVSILKKSRTHGRERKAPCRVCVCLCISPPFHIVGNLNPTRGHFGSEPPWRKFVLIPCIHFCQAPVRAADLIQEGAERAEWGLPTARTLIRNGPGTEASPSHRCTAGKEGAAKRKKHREGEGKKNGGCGRSPPRVDAGIVGRSLDGGSGGRDSGGAVVPCCDVSAVSFPVLEQPTRENALSMPRRGPV